MTGNVIPFRQLQPPQKEWRGKCRCGKTTVSLTAGPLYTSLSRWCSECRSEAKATIMPEPQP